MLLGLTLLGTALSGHSVPVYWVAIAAVIFGAGVAVALMAIFWKPTSEPESHAYQSHLDDLHDFAKAGMAQVRPHDLSDHPKPEPIRETGALATAFCADFPATGPFIEQWNAKVGRYREADLALHRLCKETLDRIGFSAIETGFADVLKWHMRGVSIDDISFSGGSQQDIYAQVVLPGPGRGRLPIWIARGGGAPLTDQQEEALRAALTVLAASPEAETWRVANLELNESRHTVWQALDDARTTQTLDGACEECRRRKGTRP
jgi:hypothetical protein